MPVPIHYVCLEVYIMCMISTGQGDCWPCHSKISMDVAIVKGGDPPDVMYMATLCRQRWTSNSRMQMGVFLIAGCFPAMSVHMSVEIIAGVPLGFAFC